MAATGPKNLYHRRLVAESSAKACWICYKPSSTVLITPEQDDWFHLCPGHLADSKFAIAKDVDAIAERKREEEVQKEIDLLKKEYEEKVRRKAEKRKQKEKDKDSTKKEEKKKEEQEDAQDEKEKEDKLKELEKKKEAEKVKVAGPRIFELQKHFFQMRLQKKRDAEMARRNRERLQSTTAFPNVPSGNP